MPSPWQSGEGVPSGQVADGVERMWPACGLLISKLRVSGEGGG